MFTCDEIITLDERSPSISSHAVTQSVGLNDSPIFNSTAVEESEILGIDATNTGTLATVVSLNLFVAITRND